MKSQDQMRAAAASQRAHRAAARVRADEHAEACEALAHLFEYGLENWEEHLDVEGQALVVTALRHYAHVRPRVRGPRPSSRKPW